MRAIPSSWWSTILSFFRHDKADLGMICYGSGVTAVADSTIHDSGTNHQQEREQVVVPILRSLDDSSGESIRICFRNRTDRTLLLCWIDQKNQPHHFYCLHPSTRGEETDSHHDDDSSSFFMFNDHHYHEDVDRIELSYIGHAFLLAYCDDIDQVRKNKSLINTTIIGGYRPEKVSILGPTKNPYPIHVVTILDQHILHKNNRQRRECCWPQYSGSSTCRTSSRYFRIKVQEATLDPTPIDTTQKKYIQTTIAGWPVCIEANCPMIWKNYNQNNHHQIDPKLEQMLQMDFQRVQECLPHHACEVLRQKTIFWINYSLNYGPKIYPIHGRHMCYHPGKDWLIENGMNLQKYQCVEMYSTQDYLNSRNCWQPGGLFLHELCHAYHNQCLPNGYNNQEIKECYELAMKEKLYQEVCYHTTTNNDDQQQHEGSTMVSQPAENDHQEQEEKGSSSTTRTLLSSSKTSNKAKAYACTNEMEYFAELSTAFLGGINDSIEFNKWYPFNRKQLQEHDPRAYTLLKKLWKME